MAIEKKLDKTWYWLGYTCGANTRKEIKELPRKITNLGDRGVSLIPTETQRVSFFIGMLVGRGKLVQNFDVVKVVQYQDKKARKKGDYLTLGMTEVKGQQGSTVKMPVIISNNSVDNRGYIGFQAKISYPTQYLTFTNLTQHNPLITTLNYQHDAAAGVVLVQGMLDSVSYADAIQVFLEFNISNDCPSSQTITMCGPSGTGQGSDILTHISGEIYYIQPLTLENGLIKLPDQEGQYQPSQPYQETIPSIGDNYDYYGGFTSLTYAFDMGLSYGGNSSGGGQGGGADLAIKITFGDGSSQTVYIPVQEGYYHYSGKIPMTLPSMKHGPIKITIWVEGEDEDDLWYWFIKAGALWGFETEIPREEVGEYEETQVEKPRNAYEFLRLSDHCLITYYAPPTPVGPTEISIIDKVNTIIDEVVNGGSWSESELEARGEILSEIIDDVVNGGSWSESSESSSEEVGMGDYVIIEYYENEV